MKKDYQTDSALAAMALPDSVAVTMTDLAEELHEGLLALAVGAGLQVLDAILEEDVVALAGPRGRHDPERVAVRHGHEEGAVTLGGRRVPVRRPRVRSADGSTELALPAYEHFSSTEVLGRLAMEKMLAKLSTRRYGAGLEPVGERVEQKRRATSRSAVSRRFVEATERCLGELLSTNLSDLDLVCLMVDGVHFADHLCVVAMGIDVSGRKHPLALAEGDTENATVVKDLLVSLRDRGLDMTRPILAVIDGSKALASGVRAVLDHPVVHRCQLHKIRNVESKLPKELARTVTKKLRAIYHYDDVLRAESELEELARQLQRSHPGAAGSLREGLAETLTVMRLKVPPTLARTLRSTNAIESMIEICRDHSSNVKRWRDGQMALRWCAAGMAEAAKQFRKVNGFLHLPALRVALDVYVESGVTPLGYKEEEEDAA
ncbi:MAG: IS256 family transposase [Acidimicrobiales bacterium]